MLKRTLGERVVQRKDSVSYTGGVKKGTGLFLPAEKGLKEGQGASWAEVEHSKGRRRSKMKGISPKNRQERD